MNITLVYKHVTTGHWHLKTVHNQDDLDEIRESDFVGEVVILWKDDKNVASDEDVKRIMMEMETTCRELGMGVSQ